MARFAELNQDDQSARVWISTIVMPVASTLVALLRVWIRSQMLGFDDGAAGIAQLLAYGNVVSVAYALVHGLAKSTDHTGERINLVYGEALQASIVLYLLTLAAAKVSVVLLLRRLFAGTRAMHAPMLCNVLLTMTGLWGVGAIVASSVNCVPEHLWRSQENATCNGSAIWMTITIIDVIGETAILLVTFWLVSQVQVPRRKKFSIFTYFTLRLTLIVTASVHYHYYLSTLHSTTTDTAISHVVFWQQIGILCTLGSITWPCTKAFINSLNTAEATSSAYGRSMNRTTTSDGQTTSAHTWPRKTNVATANALKGPETHHEGESQEMIIRREDRYIVTSDVRGT
ncbi:hypothetical protein Q7P37_000684 [Cladosporium fusiforme]